MRAHRPTPVRLVWSAPPAPVKGVGWLVWTGAAIVMLMLAVIAMTIVTGLGLAIKAILGIP